MKWSMDGPDGWWMGWDGRLVGHPEVMAWAEDLKGHSVPMTPTGPGYRIGWPPDEVAAYLIASLLLHERTVRGERPVLPLPEHDDCVDY
ncbi:MAG: hypothetical protein V7738_09875 [Dietzia maris]